MTITDQDRAIDRLRRYLCAVATACASASGDPNPAEVLAAAHVLQWDVPQALERLRAA